MNFDTLLAQYLYQNKKLDLPGIGTFEADSSVYLPEENEKQKPSLGGITFRNTNISKADDSLIDFLTVQTGKMKPLAISDLESYLALGKQFLYIGKPFYLEGIGTLQLRKDGRFEFLPGEYVTTKLDDPNVERSEGKKRSVHEEDRIQQESSNNNIKIALLVLGILGTFGLIGWGGYYLYNMNANRQASSATNDSAMLSEDDAAILPQEDSLLSPPANEDIPPAQSNTITGAGDISVYKYVVEVTDNKLRAFNRYRDLRSYDNKIEMETKDSIHFKLFYAIPSTAGDTLRLRDSLNRWYYGNTNTIRVRVEK